MGNTALEPDSTEAPKKQSQRLGLVWDKEREPEQVVLDCQEKFPVLKEVTSKKIIKDEKSPTNIIIEGDNYHALSVLNYTHEGKIDLIYIDPPYNTGSKDFVYNDRFVNNDDEYRHSKWLQFMDRRIRIAKNLLTSRGAIFVSIDDNEYPRLFLLMEDIFGEKNLKTICVKMSEPTGLKMASVIQNGRIPKLKEYLIIAKKDGIKNLNIDKIPKEKWDGEYKTIIRNATKKDVEEVKKIRDNPQRNEIEVERVKKIICKWERVSLKKYYQENKIIENKEKFLHENAWRIIRIASMEGHARELAKSKKKVNPRANFFPIITPRGMMYLIDGSFNSEVNAPRCKVLFADDYLEMHVGDFWHDIKTTGLEAEGGIAFKNGKKPLKLLKRIINTNIDKDISILDFFAGSGTTGEAVLEANKEDGGKRSFILCSDNVQNICSLITYKRIKNAMEGYSGRGPLGGNIRYFKTDFIPYKNKATDSVKANLMEKAIGMICIKENAFKEIIKSNGFKIFKGVKLYLGIIFKYDSLEEFKKEIKKISQESVSVYVFALFGEGPFEGQFKKFKNVQVIPVPDAIIKVYRRLFWGIVEK